MHFTNSTSSAHNSKAVRHKPYRLVFYGAVNPLRLILELPRTETIEYYSRQRCCSLEKKLEWPRFSDQVAEPLESHSANIRGMLRSGDLVMPAGCLMVAVQSYIGVSVQHPYTTDGFVYISDAGAIPRGTAIRAIEDTLSRDYGRTEAREKLYRICHGETYVQLGRGVMMVCPHRARDVIAACDAYPAIARYQETEEPSLPPAAVIATQARLRPVLSIRR